MRRRRTSRGNYRRDLFTTDGAASSLLGADREAVRLARAELWEDQLRALATAFGLTLDNRL